MKKHADQGTAPTLSEAPESKLPAAEILRDVTERERAQDKARAILARNRVPQRTMKYQDYERAKQLINSRSWDGNEYWYAIKVAAEWVGV